MTLASQARTKLTRDARYRKKTANDGWRWLWRSIQTWLWIERERPIGARQHGRLTKEQKKLSRKLSNREFYEKNRERLTLEVRQTRKWCPEVRDKWERNRRLKRVKEVGL